MRILTGDNVFTFLVRSWTFCLLTVLLDIVPSNLDYSVTCASILRVCDTTGNPTYR